MAAQPFEDNDDKPLDPAVARVQARLRRLMLISGLTLAVGIFAVFAAILYRIVSDGAGAVPEVLPPDVAAPALTAADMGLPADARLVSTAVDGTRLVLTYAHAGGHTLVFIDAEAMVVTGRLELPAQ